MCIRDSCHAGPRDGTDRRAASCFCAKWGEGARPNGQAPCHFLGDGAKGRRAKRARLNRQAPLLFRGWRKELEDKAPARTGRHPYYFLGDGAKGRRAKRPPVSFPSGMFIRPFNGLFRARPGGGQPVSAFSCGASGPRPARQTADKPPARAQTPPRRNRRLSAGTSAYPAHS